MKKILYGLVIMGIGFASCNKEPQPLSKQEMSRRIDSITSAQRVTSAANAQKDLERRIKIEVKVMADSLLNQKLHPKVKDTVRKAKPLFPNKVM